MSSRSKKIMAVAIIAALAIASASLWIRSINKGPSFQISIRVLGPGGSPVKNATVYLFAISPNGPDPLVGKATTNSEGDASLNIYQKMKPILEEWREFGDISNISGEFLSSIWISISYPGGFSTGYTISYNPFSSSFDFHKTIKLMKAPIKGAPKPFLAKIGGSGNLSYELFSLREVQIPFVCVQSLGEIHVASSFAYSSGGDYLSCKGGFSLSPPVKRGKLNSTPPSTLGIGEATFELGNVSTTLALQVWANGSSSLYLDAIAKYVGKVWETREGGAFKYFYEEDAYVVALLPNKAHPNLLKLDIREGFPPAMLGSDLVKYGSYAGKGYVTGGENWLNSLVELGEEKLIPCITLEGLVSKAYSQQFVDRCGIEVGVPLGKVLSNYVTPRFAPKDALKDVMISFQVGTSLQGLDAVFWTFSDAPKGVHYEACYLMSSKEYLLESSNGEYVISKLLVGISVSFRTRG